ncbi:hypothetical protein [Cerasicoccus arenae]|uniref:T9SS C-terminal target domain-containing protein n=1 Tax=Cerasicoccus arenae TaxID=424488 RepID=A0A8J3DHD0_9BACT|nr:hypothetical protein [Cerasicoccus arenae]MBK1858265.1 hypothetical protein [Cerasicoccus arenae]GHC02269.1 hypothetical protein GCM10007047_18510 [Cerasicoccus arenae]
MKHKSQLILAALCAAPFASGITYLDETVAGINKLNNGVGQAPSYEIDTNLNLGTAFPGETEFVLPAVVFVNNGATLTIPAGTIMRGQPRIVAGTSDAPGALIVTEDGMIDAVGTATAPIIWTTAATGTIGSFAKYVKGNQSPVWLDPSPLLSPLAPQISGTNTTKLWGGVALLGKAPNNLAGTRPPGLVGRGTLEGLPASAGANAYYGGSNPNDSSGRIIYNSIRHNGDILADGDEIQGLTLGSAGYGTELKYIEIYCSADDGIEIFGGTSFMDHILISFVEDDGLDLDQGYSGAIQYLVSIMANNTTYPSFGGGNAGEWDGDDYSSSFDSTGLPLTYPTFYNMTFVGASDNGNKGLNADTGWGGNLYNSIVYNFPTEGFAFGNGGFPGTNSSDRIANDTIDFSGVVFFNSPSTTANAGTVISSGFNNTTAITLLGNSQVVGTNGLIPVPTGSATEYAVFPSFGLGVGYTGNYFTPASYKGAFDPDTTATIWTTGWTALNHLDMIPDRADGLDVDGL